MANAREKCVFVDSFGVSVYENLSLWYLAAMPWISGGNNYFQVPNYFGNGNLSVLA